jgi:hypothetical protein
MVGAGVGVAALLLAVMPIAKRLLDAEPSGVEYSLITYDLGGISYYGKADAFPPMTPVKDARAINAGCYNSISWDRYAWWGDAPCAIGFGTVRAAFAASGKSATLWWLREIARHPLAYAMHRLGHFNRNIRLWTTDSALPTLSLKSDPNHWGLRVEPNRLSAAIDGLATRSERTPLGWPVWWIALGAGALAFWRTRGIAAPMLWSGLLYALSFLPLSVASEVRYHLWTMLALGLGAAHALDEQWQHPPRGWPMAKVALVVAAVTAACVAARL